MAFRATNAVTSDAYLGMKRTASQLKLNVDTFIQQVQTSDTDYGRIQAIYYTLKNADDRLDELKVTPGLATYAEEQEDDPAYDFQAEAQAMLVAITDAMTWIDTNIPVTNRSLKAIDQWESGATIVADFFTPAQTSGLQTLLQAVTDSIS